MGGGNLFARDRSQKVRSHENSGISVVVDDSLRPATLTPTKHTHIKQNLSIRDGKMNIRDGFIKPNKNGRSCQVTLYTRVYWNY
jgi:hypothetical protein